MNKCLFTLHKADKRTFSLDFDSLKAVQYFASWHSHSIAPEYWGTPNIHLACWARFKPWKTEKLYCPWPGWMRIVLSTHSPSPSHLSAYSTQECWPQEQAHILVRESMQPSHSDWQREHNEYNITILHGMLLKKFACYPTLSYLCTAPSLSRDWNALWVWKKTVCRLLMAENINLENSWGNRCHGDELFLSP